MNLVRAQAVGHRDWSCLGVGRIHLHYRPRHTGNKIFPNLKQKPGYYLTQDLHLGLNTAQNALTINFSLGGHGKTIKGL